MTNILKIILWVIVLVLVAFLIIGRDKNKVAAPTAEDMQFGAGGERDESPEPAGSSGTEMMLNTELETSFETNIE